MNEKACLHRNYHYNSIVALMSFRGHLLGLLKDTGPHYAWVVNGALYLENRPTALGCKNFSPPPISADWSPIYVLIFIGKSSYSRLLQQMKLCHTHQELLKPGQQRSPISNFIFKSLLKVSLCNETKNNFRCPFTPLPRSLDYAAREMTAEAKRFPLPSMHNLHY